jgi:hypothetical protein
MKNPELQKTGHPVPVGIKFTCYDDYLENKKNNVEINKFLFIPLLKYRFELNNSFIK